MDAASIVFGPWIAIEVAMDAGSSKAGDRHDNIGNFKATGNEFTGEIATLTIQATNVRIVPAKKTTDNGPSHRVYVGQAEVGAAWSKLSKEKRPYLSVRLDDPSLITPVYANLLADENGRGHNLIWSRGTRRDRD